MHLPLLCQLVLGGIRTWKSGAIGDVGEQHFFLRKETPSIAHPPHHTATAFHRRSNLPRLSHATKRDACRQTPPSNCENARWLGKRLCRASMEPFYVVRVCRSCPRPASHPRLRPPATEAKSTCGQGVVVCVDVGSAHVTKMARVGTIADAPTST